MSGIIQYINKDSIYLAKKHYCPDCKCEVKKVKVSNVANDASEEDKDLPKMFSKTLIGSKGIKFRTYNYIGDTTYVWKEFECEKCRRHFTVEEIEGIADSQPQERSPEEIKKIKIKKLIFNKVLPISIVILIAVLQYFLEK